MAFATLLERADRIVLEQLSGDEAITYTPSGGAAEPVDGVFDAAYRRVEAGEAGVSTSEPAVFFRLDDLPSDPTTDDATVTVGGTAYRIREAEPDGQGGVRLFLQRVA